VLDAPPGNRWPPFLPEIATRLTAFGELDISDRPATIGAIVRGHHDRRAWPATGPAGNYGPSGTKPGSLLKSQIPIGHGPSGTTPPRFVEIDLVGTKAATPRTVPQH